MDFSLQNKRHPGFGTPGFFPAGRLGEILFQAFPRWLPLLASLPPVKALASRQRREGATQDPFQEERWWPVSSRPELVGWAWQAVLQGRGLSGWTAVLPTGPTCISARAVLIARNRS